MSGYLLTIIGTVLLSAVLTAIIPDGKTSILIKSITRLVCVLSIISPVLRFFQKGYSIFGEVENSEDFFSETVIEADSSFIQYYSELRIRETEIALKNELEKNFMPIKAVSLNWTIENQDINIIKIVGISVELSEKSKEEEIEKMYEYLTKNYCSEVLIE